MEDLNKQQLILLALLVSFVTSVATGIATVSLLDQAPARVTRVINNVVERTVEQVDTIVPGDLTERIITEETIVVIRQDEAVTEAVDVVSSRLVSVRNDKDEVVGAGFIVGDEAYIVASGENIEKRGDYEVVFAGGIALEGTVVAQSEDKTLSILVTNNPDEEVILESTPLGLGNPDSLELGNGVFALGGEALNEVNLGIISRLDVQGDEEERQVTRIRTNLDGGLVIEGTALFTVFGELIGVNVASESTEFIPVGFVMDLLATLN